MSLQFHQLRVLLIALLVVLAATPRLARGQLRPFEVPELNTQLTVSGVSKLRVGTVSSDGTEVLLLMEYSYNGSAGPNAQLVPVIESRKRKGVSQWFGADPVTVPQGKGPLSIKVKFFNDEPGVPATLTTDLIRVLILNSTGTAVVGGDADLKTIHWGKPVSKPEAVSEDVEVPAETGGTIAAHEPVVSKSESKRTALTAAEPVAEETLPAASEKPAKTINPQPSVVEALDAGKVSRTRITNIEVVNRNLDRSEMTFGIEFDRRDNFKFMGVTVDHASHPEIGEAFACEPKEIGRQKYAIVKVACTKSVGSSLVTDRLLVFGSRSPDAAETIPLHTATMLLVWRTGGNRE